MRASSLRLVLLFPYVLILILLVGCGSEPAPMRAVATAPSSLVVVDTWVRDDHKATGMDIMVRVPEGVAVDSVTVKYHDEWHVTRYSDLCVVWVRAEDGASVQWGSDAAGTTLTCYPPTKDLVLPSGTWVARMHFIGEVPPMAAGCFCSEQVISNKKGN